MGETGEVGTENSGERGSLPDFGDQATMTEQEKQRWARWAKWIEDFRRKTFQELNITEEQFLQMMQDGFDLIEDRIASGKGILDLLGRKRKVHITLIEGNADA